MDTFVIIFLSTTTRQNKLVILSSKKYYFLPQKINVMVGKLPGQRKVKTGVVHGFRQNYLEIQGVESGGCP